MYFFLCGARSVVLVLIVAVALYSQISGPYVFSAGSAANEEVADFCVDSSGSYITAFTFANSITFPGGTNPEQTVSSNGLVDNGLVRYDFLGNLQWAASWGSATTNDQPVALACSRDGFIYVAGTFGGSMNAVPRFGSQTVTSNGGTDVYLIKLTNEGNFVWARTFGGAQDDRPLSLAISPDGTLALLLTFRESIDANPSPDATHNVFSRGGQDILLVRLSANGNFLWARSLSGSGDEGVGGGAVTFDAFGNVLAAGTFTGNVILNPILETPTFTSTGTSNAFLASYDLDGRFQAARAIRGEGEVFLRPSSLAIDANDDIFLAGSFRRTIDVDLAPATERLLSSRLNTLDFFMASYTSLFTLRWAHAIGGFSDDQLSSMHLDRNGSMVVAGRFAGQLVLNPGAGDPGALQATGFGGATDGFVGKYRATNGAFVSGFNLGTAGTGQTLRNAIVGAQIDTMGNLVVAGNLFGENMDFDRTSEQVLRSSNGGSDLFLASYDWRSQLRQPNLELQGPILRATTNAASFLPAPAVPGSLATLFGLNISTRLPGMINPDIARSFPVGTKLCNTEVVFRTKDAAQEWKAPILFCSDFQINYQVPTNLPEGYLTLHVVADDRASNDLEVLVRTDDIGLFMEDAATNVGAMTFAFGSRRGQKVLPTNSITACDIVEIYTTGLGPVIPRLPDDGTPAGEALRTQGDAKVVVYDDGRQGRLPGFEVPPRILEFRRDNGLIKYTGLSPQFVGLYQINMEWPNPQDPNLPLQLRLNQGDYPAYIEFRGRRSQRFTITVRYSAENPSPCRGGFF